MMFYDKKINILAEGEGYLDDAGIYHEGNSSILKSILCDVQPYSREQAYRDYSFNEEVTYRIFCDPKESIKVGIEIEYKTESFIVKKIVDWDDYWEVMIHGK